MAYGTVNVCQQPQDSLEPATEKTDGLMSAEDKKKLNRLPADAASIKIANGTMVVTQPSKATE